MIFRGFFVEVIWAVDTRGTFHTCCWMHMEGGERVRDAGENHELFFKHPRSVGVFGLGQIYVGPP